MMVPVVLLAVLALSSAASVQESAPVCEVSDWQPWTACATAPSCRQDKSSRRTSTYHLPPTEWDAGRERMNIIKREKWLHWQAIDACRRDGSCPEFNYRKSQSRTACVNGFAGEYPCRNIDMLAFMDFDALGYGILHPSENSASGNDIWGWFDEENNQEYAIMCVSGGTSFVRVTDPENPVTLGFMYTHTVASSWHDAKVIGNWVYIVSEAADHGLQAFDLTRLRDMTGFSFLDPDYHYDRFGNAHNIVANPETGFLYVVGATRGSGYDLCGGGLHIIDVRDPRNPIFAGCFGGDGYVHDAECVIYRGPDVQYFEHEICFCYNEDTFTIVDVTDHANAVVISKTGYMTVGYTHQGWLTADHTIAIMDDEADERDFSSITTTQTYLWDVTSLGNPILRNIFESTEPAIDHNLYIIGNLVYQSNYEAGLRITNLDPAAFELSEMAYFDVLPSRTTLNFAGTWSNYPYLPSGIVLVSSMDFGMFILQPDYDAIQDEINSQMFVTEQVRYRQILKYEPGAVCPSLVETQKCQATEC